MKSKPILLKELDMGAPVLDARTYADANGFRAGVVMTAVRLDKNRSGEERYYVEVFNRGAGGTHFSEKSLKEALAHGRRVAREKLEEMRSRKTLKQALRELAELA